MLDGALARRRWTQLLIGRGLFGAVALTLALTAPAAADTTVSVDGSMNLVATGNDEPSNVTITQTGTNAFTVADPAADLTATLPCTGGGATVSCTGVTNVLMANGNGGDDNITVAAAITCRAFLDGGAGADKLTGGAGADNLRGGVGVNEMRGGDGADDVQGCSDEDELLFGEAGDDIITTCDGTSKQLIGGPGDDFMSSNVGRAGSRWWAATGWTRASCSRRAWGHGST